MFRITEAPSTGSLVQCLAKNYKNDSILSVDMDKVGVMAAYCDLLYVCEVHCIGRTPFLYSEPHTHTHTHTHTYSVNKITKHKGGQCWGLRVYTGAA